MHRVLWDAYVHVHHPLIEEMLLHMCIGWNTTIAILLIIFLSMYKLSIALSCIYRMIIIIIMLKIIQSCAACTHVKDYHVYNSI